MDNAAATETKPTRDDLLEEGDARIVIQAWVGDSFMGGWPSDDEDSLRAAVRDELVFAVGAEAAGSADVTVEPVERDYSLATATITLGEPDDDGDFFATVTFSDARVTVHGYVYISERDADSSPDAWLNGGLDMVDPDIIRALGSGGFADGSPMTLEVPAAVQASESSDGWHAVDTVGGGRWWPNGEAAAEIEASDDEEQAVLRLCAEHPDRGEWRD